MHQAEQVDRVIAGIQDQQISSLPDHKTSTLLCVLDWGLGHAARSLALLEQLRTAGTPVHLAASGRARAFLVAALPGETIHKLPSYNVRYSSGNMPLNVAWQLPKWVRTIVRERRETAALVARLGVGRIISDSRFGCFHPSIPSVMLTHQLQPITNNGIASWLYQWWLQRFTECWVPDYPDRRLSGKLSDPTGYGKVRYIGPLSRLKPSNVATEPYDCLALLSGPEPMRSRLEEELIPILTALPGRHLLVRGVPSDRPATHQGNLKLLDFADAPLLERHLPVARYVICRAGYSTVMDLAVLKAQGKRLFIPTPGQTEQEYLARTRVQSKVKGAVLEQGRLTKQLAGAVQERR
ncbi:MAG: glycosyltransferase [Bacteroidota bacterium]